MARGIREYVFDAKRFATITRRLVRRGQLPGALRVHVYRPYGAYPRDEVHWLLHSLTLVLLYMP